MRMKQEKKLHDLQKDREMDFYMIKERYENDPFGRQGAGAPKRDIFGNIITRRPKFDDFHPNDPRLLL
jgi:hypothetical protein